MRIGVYMYARSLVLGLIQLLGGYYCGSAYSVKLADCLTASTSANMEVMWKNRKVLVFLFISKGEYLLPALPVLAVKRAKAY